MLQYAPLLKTSAFTRTFSVADSGTKSGINFHAGINRHTEKEALERTLKI